MAADDKGLIVVVDDEPAMLKVAERVLSRAGYRVVTCDRPSQALAALDEGARLLLSDIHMPEMTGLELLARARERHPTMPVVLMTGNATLESAIKALRLGAYDYVRKPFEPLDLLLVAVERALEHGNLIAQNRELQRRLSRERRYEEIIGSSRAMHELFTMIGNVAPTDVTALILGESGTGKELIARAIHRDSPRSGRPFVAINCGALAETMLESELFGHERGAFTGAVTARRGLFEEASGGTLMLDEVGEIPPATQVRLLRVLQERRIRRLGANEERDVDVRVLAATHRDLAAEVEAGRFRQDLLFRLDVVRIHVPPLRERMEDLPLLVRHLIAKHAAKHGRAVDGISDEALAALSEHGWPGNVRELENTIERAVVLSRGSTLDTAALPLELRPAVPSTELWRTPAEVPSYADARDQFEQSYLKRVVDAAGGNMTMAAKIAGVDRSNFRRLLKRRGIRES